MHRSFLFSTVDGFDIDDDNNDNNDNSNDDNDNDDSIKGLRRPWRLF